MTQKERILMHLEQNGSINPNEAKDRYGIMRLASRICELKKLGYPIKKEMVIAQNRYGEPVTYASYSLGVRQ